VLAAAGFVVEHTEASLTYLGFALAGGRSLLSSDARVVAAVEPSGPAAAAGLQRGDTIVAVEAILRGDPPWIAPAVDRRYDAGLSDVGGPGVLQAARGERVLFT
jgi:predicted metalloprotease with PDZ domain